MRRTESFLCFSHDIKNILVTSNKRPVDVKRERKKKKKKKNENGVRSVMIATLKSKVNQQVLSIAVVLVVVILLFDGGRFFVLAVVVLCAFYYESRYFCLCQALEIIFRSNLKRLHTPFNTNLTKVLSEFSSTSSFRSIFASKWLFDKVLCRLASG